MVERKMKLILEKHLKIVVSRGLNEHIEQAKNELQAYFNAQQKQFNVVLAPQGSAFQQSVWQALQTISYGKTTSYLEQAQSLGKASAVRAIANANGANKISIIIPCHRVIW